MKRILSTAAVVLVAFLMGCGKDNPVKPMQPGPKYLPSSTPLNVLYNLQRAYTSRDSTGYDSLFAADYTGSSTDQSDNSQLTFSKSDEALHIQFLANQASITSIDLQFPPGLVRYTDLGDPPGWATVSTASMHLEINTSATSYAIYPNETIDFKFRPTMPSPGSPTDTTWHIVRWLELAP
ncbi:MAG TPA: hypothetical protein VEU09_08535 [Candidatus Binatia bacterium]|nr:hypothetical protein [Candidatus Binatia bacterium]